MPGDAGEHSGARLLHLDLHPYNLLVDADGALTGVLDWASAAAGPLVLDRARTWAILTLDPAARARHRSRAGPAKTVSYRAHTGETMPVPGSRSLLTDDFFYRVTS